MRPATSSPRASSARTRSRCRPAPTAFASERPRTAGSVTSSLLRATTAWCRSTNHDLIGPAETGGLETAEPSGTPSRRAHVATVLSAGADSEPRSARIHRPSERPPTAHADAPKPDRLEPRKPEPGTRKPVFPLQERTPIRAARTHRPSERPPTAHADAPKPDRLEPRKPEPGTRNPETRLPPTGTD